MLRLAPLVATSYALKVVEAARTIACSGNQTILDACLEAGIPFMHNCRSGECGECIARLLEGDVEQLPGTDPALFKGREHDGSVLACMCYPRSDITVSVPLSKIAMPPVGEIDALIENLRPQGKEILEVTVRLEETVRYRAGQYFEWVLPGISPNRRYSAASRSGSRTLEFHVRLYPNGRIGRLFSSGQLLKGDLLSLRGPYGNFGLTESEHRPAILVAGGTGMAPMKAMLDEAFSRDSKRSVTYFYGARCVENLYQVSTLERWVRDNPAFSFVPALSEEPAGSTWNGKRGLITDVLAQELTNDSNAEIYLCGPPPMIDAAIEVATRRGVNPSDIRYDSFSPVE